VGLVVCLRVHGSLIGGVFVALSLFVSLMSPRSLPLAMSHVNFIEVTKVTKVWEELVHGAGDGVVCS